MTAAERGGKYQAEYVPPPPPAPGKIVVRAPVDHRGQPIHPDLHLAPEHAEALRDALDEALEVYLQER